MVAKGSGGNAGGRCHSSAVPGKTAGRPADADQTMWSEHPAENLGQQISVAWEQVPNPVDKHPWR